MNVQDANFNQKSTSKLSKNPRIVLGLLWWTSINSWI